MKTIRKPTVTITLSVDTAAALQKMVDHYGTLSNPTGCATAALETGLAVYAKQLKLDISTRLKELHR